MSNSSRDLSLSAGSTLESKHTPGPWAWFGSDYGLYLATTHSGRRYVMGFRRMGTQGAQPVFQVNQRMVPAAELVQFEVGDQDVRGFKVAKEDASVYRYDVRGIDAPDARLIAAAPELLVALRALTFTARTSGGVPGRDEELMMACEMAESAIAKATGQ